VDLARRFRPLVRSKPTFANPPREKDAVWLTPVLVAQIGFQEWTADGKLRQARYLGLRDDKSAREVRLPERAP
jgi:bifunctional non-homologous end joining protein LigD